MAKKTLLTMVQQILSEADGDTVTGISDTVESQQCADLIGIVFDEVVQDYDLGLTKSIIQLTATSSATPNVMTRPEDLYNIEWIKYDKRTAAGNPQQYETVHYMEPARFIEYVSSRSTDLSNVDAVALDSGHSIPVVNDQAPTYFTFMEDYDDIIFDSYDSALETELQAGKSLAYGQIIPSLSIAGTSTIDLPKQMTALVQASARARFWDLYKGGATREIDRARRRAEVRAMRYREMMLRTNQDTGPYYGRK